MNLKKRKQQIARRKSNKLVEIAGGIASGKTTLLNALSGVGAHPVYENHALNPYWHDSYSEPGAYTFETEISFLLQHYHFAKKAQSLEAVVILDHSFELDLAYAKVGLVGKRNEIFEAIYNEVREELGPPELLIWLRCTPEEEGRRIQARNREIEQNIDLRFLTDLNGKLEATIHSFEKRGVTSVIQLDSEENDFRSSGPWLTSLASNLGIRSQK